MMDNMKETLIAEIKDFELPGYNEIPNVGLYLEQTTKYISEYFIPLENVTLTGSMTSNYVKKKIIKNPVKKQYDREQIAYLFFIAVAKSVISLDDIQLLIRLQQETCDLSTAYAYFRSELKAVLNYVFGITESLESYSEHNSSEKLLLRKTIMAVANKIYLDKVFDYIRNQDQYKTE